MPLDGETATAATEGAFDWIAAGEYMAPFAAAAPTVGEYRFAPGVATVVPEP